MRYSAARILQGDQRVRYHAPRERVASYVVRAAHRFGLRPATLHNLLHGDRPIPALLAAVVEEAAREGKLDRAEPFFLPIEAAARQVTPQLTKQLLMRALVARNDAAEAAHAFLLNECDATREQLKRRVEVARSTDLELWRAL